MESVLFNIFRFLWPPPLDRPLPAAADIVGELHSIGGHYTGHKATWGGIFFALEGHSVHLTDFHAEQNYVCTHAHTRDEGRNTPHLVKANRFQNGAAGEREAWATHQEMGKLHRYRATRMQHHQTTAEIQACGQRMPGD